MRPNSKIIGLSLMHETGKSQENELFVDRGL